MGDLFKYRAMNLYSLDNLINDTIWASNPNGLNDPFEELRLSEYTEQFIKFYNNNQLEWEKVTDPNVDTRPGFKEIAGLKRTGIFSTSTCHKVKLLWSLYADELKGFVIGYDKQKLLSIKDGTNFDIRYTDKLDFSKTNLAIEDINERHRAFFSQKLKAWEHEKEYRITFQESGLKPLLPNSVTSIYIGSKMQQSHQDIIRAIAQLKSIKLFRVSPMRLIDGKGKEYFDLKEEEI